MKRWLGSTPEARRTQRGSARVKFIIVVAVLATVGYMAFQYVPVAYQASSYKRRMDDVTREATATGKGTEWVRAQLEGSAADYGVPKEAKIVPSIQDGRMIVSVHFTRPVNLLPGIWTYDYPFDYTAKSTEFLTK